MPEHFLHAAQIAPFVQNMRCESVPERVRAHFLFKARPYKPFVQHAPCRSLFQPFAFIAKKSRRVYIGRNSRGASFFYIFHHYRKTFVSRRHYSFFIAFSAHFYGIAEKIYIFYVQTHQLFDSESARIKNFYHRSVAQFHAVNIKKVLHLVLRKKFRHPFFFFRTGHAFKGAFFNYIVYYQKFIKGA